MRGVFKNPTYSRRKKKALLSQNHPSPISVCHNVCTSNIDDDSDDYVMDDDNNNNNNNKKNGDDDYDNGNDDDDIDGQPPQKKQKLSSIEIQKYSKEQINGTQQFINNTNLCTIKNLNTFNKIKKFVYNKKNNLDDLLEQFVWRDQHFKDKLALCQAKEKNCIKKENTSKSLINKHKISIQEIEEEIRELQNKLIIKQKLQEREEFKLESGLQNKLLIADEKKKHQNQLTLNRKFTTKIKKTLMIFNLKYNDIQFENVENELIKMNKMVLELIGINDKDDRLNMLRRIAQLQSINNKKENSNDPMSKSLCLKCVERHSNMINQPCGHTTYCNKCMEEKIEFNCPTCNAKVQAQEIRYTGFCWQ